MSGTFNKESKWLAFEKLGIKLDNHYVETAQDIMNGYAGKLFSNPEKKIINENEFAKCFRDVNNLQYSNGLFYTNRGKETEDVIAQDIWKSLDGCGISQDVATKTNKLLGAVKLASTVPNLKPKENIIPFKNGDFDYTTKTFYLGVYNPTPYRLSVDLVTNYKSSKSFKKWLNDLFMPEDIPVIQQYLGYCLVPNTKAQKALFLVGEGGAGKSVMGVILESLLGNAMVSTANTQEFMSDKFKLPELENKLVLYDDDLDSAALSATGLYKKLITNTQPITADRKYGQPFQFTPQIKIVSCCNEMLSSNTDQTSGFFRRLHPILIKPIADDFKPDLNFYDKIRNEKEDILLWALEGLFTLMGNNWELPVSQRTLDYLNNKQSIANPFPEFMNSVFEFRKDYNITTNEINAIKDYWARQNGVEKYQMNNFDKWLTDNGEKYGVKRSRTIKRNGKYLRGVEGMQIKAEWQLNSSGIELS